MNDATARVLKMSKADKTFISMGSVMNTIRCARISFNDIDMQEVRHHDFLELLSILGDFREDVKEQMYNGK